ncbi:MAG TPA: protein kinase, partial [Candidatus Eisenbacteria bacterium]|nr:protein kinase [Candidatus Eisenbacteria bacterium]
MNKNVRCAGCSQEFPLHVVEQFGGLCPACVAGFATIEDPVDSPLKPGSTFGKFEIVGVIGRGGMGTVYRARHAGLGRDVALKILSARLAADPEFVRRFEREARTLASLEHPNIVAVHDTGVEAGAPYLVMEFVEGVSLRRLLAERRLPPEEALGIVPQLCDALEYAHARGVIHRDVKPENILIDTKGRTKIADFGLAVIVGAEGPRLTRTDISMGTPHYMAPEQVESSRKVDHRADIYSMGVVLYEMLTGELPLGRFGPPSDKARVNRRLDEIVLRALEKEPDRRYQQVTEFHRDIESAPQGRGERRVVRGYEYKSKRTLFGWPLVHICKGYDANGKAVPAKGIIAIGSRAIGVIAIGGSAFGIVPIGGFAMGLFAMGGFALGIFAWGGGAVGGVAVGGGAVGYVAVGGGAVGYYAHGGGGRGKYVYASNRRDPEAVAFFARWGLVTYPRGMRLRDGLPDVEQLKAIAQDASKPSVVRVQALADLYEAEVYYGMRGHRTRELVTSLLALNQDPDASVRADLCRSLAGAVPADLAAPLIQSLLFDSEASVREEAAEALGPLREVPAVQKALEEASRSDSARSVRDR